MFLAAVITAVPLTTIPPTAILIALLPVTVVPAAVPVHHPGAAAEVQRR